VMVPLTSKFTPLGDPHTVAPAWGFSTLISMLAATGSSFDLAVFAQVVNLEVALSHALPPRLHIRDRGFILY
jgi:hypothetical protein